MEAGKNHTWTCTAPGYNVALVTDFVKRFSMFLSISIFSSFLFSTFHPSHGKLYFVGSLARGRGFDFWDLSTLMNLKYFPLQHPTRAIDFCTSVLESHLSGIVNSHPVLHSYGISNLISQAFQTGTFLKFPFSPGQAK